MTFKSVKINEIQSAEYENILGLAVKREKIHSQHETQMDNSIQQVSSRMIIEFNRNNSFVLNENKLEDLVQQNYLIIRNPSKKDKIWNIKLKLNEINQDIAINEISPNDFWEHLIEEKSEITPSIVIREIVNKKGYSKNFEDKSYYYIQKGIKNEFYCTLFLKNKSDKVLHDVRVKKTLPASLNTLLEIRCSVGTINRKKNHFSWSTSKLESQQSIIIQYKIVLNSNPCKSGQIIGTYKEYFNDFSFYTIEELKASVKTAQFLNILEKDEEPGNWDCSFEILNRSDFLVEVEKAKLHQIHNNTKEKLFEKEHVFLQPFEEKNVYSTCILSEDRPKISKHMKFHPVPEIISYQSNSFSINENQFDLLEISASKNFSVNEIKSYQESLIDVRLKIKNESTLPINQLLFVDKMNPIFKPKNLNQITIQKNEKSYKIEDFDLDIFDGFHQKRKMKQLGSEMKQIEENNKLLKQNILSLKEKYNSFKKVINSSQDQEILKNQRILKTKISQIRKNINNLEKLNKDLENQNEEHKKELSDLETNLKELPNQIKILTELEKLRENIANQEEEIKFILKKIDKKQKKISQLNEKIQNSHDNPEKMKQLKVSKNTIEKELKKIREKRIEREDFIKNFEKSIENLQNNIEYSDINHLNQKKNDYDKRKFEISKNIEKNVHKMESKRQEIIEYQDKIKEKQAKFNSLNKKIENLNKSLKEQEKTRNEIFKCIEQYEISRNKLKTILQQMESLKKEQTNLKDKVLSLVELKSIFKNDIKKDKTGCEINILTTKSDRQLVFKLHNLDDLIDGFPPNEEIILSYQIEAHRPRHDIHYDFPTSILFDTTPSKTINLYPIPTQKLPTLEILHDRKKVSLGKIIDHYSERNKFQVMLLIKNRGHTFVNNLKIIDTLPKNAKISNAYYKYQEKIINNDIKEVVWELDQLAPLEELDISYLIELDSEEYDLNDFELILE